MRGKYWKFDDLQIENYKKILHKELFWLLLYKDPKTCVEYQYVDYDKYYDGLMKQLCGLNELLLHPVQIIKLMSLLEAAHMETQEEEFDYQSYRKLILDAHSIVDKLTEEG